MLTSPLHSLRALGILIALCSFQAASACKRESPPSESSSAAAVATRGEPGGADEAAEAFARSPLERAEHAKSAQEAPVTRGSRRLMGTLFAVEVVGPRKAEAGAAIEAALDECARIEGLLSEWREDTPISKLNREAGGAPLAMPAEVIDVLRRARALYDQSGGAFDVTWAALRGVWNFGADARPPSPETLQSNLKNVGGDGLEVEPSAGTARLQKKGMSVGLGSIGKGYGVGRMAKVLRDAGFEDFLIFGGGQIYAAGRKGDRPWRAGIQDPRSDRHFASLALKDEGLATSGDYERFFFHEGKRYHHILDLKTGQPARSGLTSVTIVAKDPTLADGLSTAVFVLGQEKGLKLLESYEGVEAVLVTQEGDVVTTPGVRKRLRIRRPPERGRP